jgi:hypothetical protein
MCKIRSVFPLKNPQKYCVGRNLKTYATILAEVTILAIIDIIRGVISN